MQWQRARGWDVDLAYGSDSDPQELPAGVRDLSIRSLVRPLSAIRDPTALRTLRKVIEDGRYDMVHTHQSKAGVLGRIAARGSAPLIVHSVHMSSFGPGYGRLASKAFLAAERYCARFTDAFVCVGDDIRERYIAARVAAPERFVTVRSPIDIDRFLGVRTVAREEKERLRALFGLDAGLPLVIAMGALEARKRQHLIVDRLEPLLTGGRVQLAIAGTGDEGERLQHSVRRAGLEGSVRLLGYVDRPQDLLATGSVFVHASACEGLPQVLVQAAAAGLPAVTTPVEGASEIPGVVLIDREALTLADAVEEAIRQPLEPVPAESFDRWRPEAVEAAIATLHRTLGVPSEF
jgi:glycosyltransferase involved in cell wall biosynthesis